MPILKVKFTAQIKSTSQGPLTIPISSFSARTSLYAEPRSTRVYQPGTTTAIWVQYMRPVVNTALSIVVPGYNFLSPISLRIPGYITITKWLNNKPTLLGSVPIKTPRTDTGSRSNSITLSGELVSHPFTITSLPTREVPVTNYNYIRQSVSTGVRCGLNNNINVGEFMLVDTIPYRVTQVSIWDSEAYGSMELTSQPISFGYVN